MCTMVVVLREGEATVCETVGELARALNVRQKRIGKGPFDVCLCGVDIVALGGRRATDEEGWPFPEYVIEVAA